MTHLPVLAEGRILSVLPGNPASVWRTTNPSVCDAGASVSHVICSVTDILL